MAYVTVTTNNGETILDLTINLKDSTEEQAKVIPAVVSAIEKAWYKE